MSVRKKDFIVLKVDLFLFFYFLIINIFKNRKVFYVELSKTIKILFYIFKYNRSNLSLSKTFPSIFTHYSFFKSKKNFGKIQLDTIEETTKISHHLINILKKNDLYLFLTDILSEKPAKAFMSKTLSHFLIYKQLLLINLYKNYNGTDHKSIIISNLFSKNIFGDYFTKKFTFLRAYSYYDNLIINLIIRIKLILKITQTLVHNILYRGITFIQSKKIYYDCAFEFIDLNRFDKNSKYDNDHIPSFFKEKNKNCFFFLTSHQFKTIQSASKITYKELSKKISRKGFKISFLDHIPLSINNLFFFTRKFYSLCFSPSKKVLYGKKLLVFLLENLLEYKTFFDNYSFNYIFYNTFPNGKSSFKINDSIITSLANKNSIKSVGCQTRAIYSSKYEDCFDCFDFYFSWGKRWDLISIYRTKYIDKILHSGCIYFDKKLMSVSKSNEKLNVVIFDGDINENTHYSSSYSKAFFNGIINLSSIYKNYNFIYKPKNKSNIDVYLQDKKINESYKKLDNLNFSRAKRNEYNNLLKHADIVISIGFTTPGYEALIHKKRSIYYSPFKYKNNLYDNFENFVAYDKDQLIRIFSNAIKDRHKYFDKNIQLIKKVNFTRKKLSSNQIIFNALYNEK